MIRGVNRHIIEVSDTQNEYFERAILFVRPEYIAENESTLRRQADSTVDKMKLGAARISGSGNTRPRGRGNAIFVMSACAAAGAVLCGGIILLISQIF